MEIDNNQGVRRSARRQEQRQRRAEQRQQNTAMEISQPNVEIQQRMQQLELEEEKVDNQQPQEQQLQQIQLQQPQQQPQLQQQQQQQNTSLQKIKPSRFLSKIPNPKVLRDFFINKGKFYVPPERDLTSIFCREILSGQKKLMKLSQVLWVDQVPNWPEFTTKNIWRNAKSDPRYIPYFPTYSGTQTPTRKYLLNIANTVKPNSVVKAVIEIREQREKQKIEEAPIILTNEFAELLQDFESISNDQRRRGLTHLREYKKCPLCLSEIRSNTGQFKCKKHKAHKKCIQTYYCSDNGKKSQYLCPLRCPK